MFDQVYKELEKIRKPVNTAPLDLFNNPAVSPNVVTQKLRENPKIDSKELYNIVKESYKSILTEIFLKKDPAYLDVFTTPSFITVLTQVLNSVELTYDEKICCNKLVYDYMTLKNNDSYTKELLFILSKMVNRDKIHDLLCLGFDENLATYLTLARFSDKKEEINVKRLNFIISTQTKDIMTVQMIVKIYEKLFDSVLVLFETIMFDVYNEEEEWVTDDIMEVYANISLAICHIINNMPIESIRKVLKVYTGDFTLMYGGDTGKIRFQMKSLSQDFSRIIYTIEQLEVEDVYVP